MINFFRKNSKKNILYFYTKHLGNDAFDIHQIINKSSSELPKWWKKIKPPSLINSGLNWEDSMQDGAVLTNVKTCPSFQELFKNSYIIKSPCDFRIIYSTSGVELESANPNLFDLVHHGSIQHDGFNPNKYNVKFTVKIPMRTSNSIHKVLFFQPLYYNDVPFEIMPGVFEILPNINSNISINTTLDTRNFTKEKQVYLGKKDTILAIMYAPNGVIDLKQVDKLQNIGNREKFIGNYMYYKNLLIK